MACNRLEKSILLKFFLLKVIYKTHFKELYQ